MPQALHREMVSAATIAEQLAPSASLFDATILSSMHGCASASDDRDAITILKARRHCRISIAANCNVRRGPALRDQSPEPPLILRSGAAGEEGSDVCRIRHHSKEPQERLVTDQFEI
jgi:hypothetical protein